MPEVCGEVHPERPEVSCDKQMPCAVAHMSREHDEAWPNPLTMAELRQRTKSDRKRLVEMADRVRPATTVGPPSLEVLSPDVRSQWENQIKHPEWVEYASKVFYDFLRERTEPFTTPEDVWPLLDAPEEMREMVQVVRRALRDGWIKEVAAKRLNDVYRTKDGIEFKMNKLVPIYQSQYIKVTFVDKING
jgi:hypothetical protein